jgi:hypothetical protein
VNENVIISKGDFLLYLKYLVSLLENEKDLLNNVKEVIDIETNYIPSVYYYHEILDAFDILIPKQLNSIHWSKISSWKTLMRKNKIKKYL